MKYVVCFVGVDEWNRPTFKEVGTRNRYFCDVDNLVRYDATEKEIIDRYNAIGTASICYKGNTFDSEPNGDPVEVEIVPKVEAIRSTKSKVNRDWARGIILNTEPDLTKEMVDKYTDSELKEWMKLLGIATDF